MLILWSWLAATLARDLKFVSKKKYLKSVTLFTTQDFLPAKASAMVADLFHHLLVQHTAIKSIPTYVANNTHSLSKHTGFVFMTYQCIVRVQWEAPSFWPNGHTVAHYQCGNCTCIRLVLQKMAKAQKNGTPIAYVFLC